MEPIFYYNGIKDDKAGKLQRCWYSSSELKSYPSGTITVYASDYSGFSSNVHRIFSVENNSDIMTDYFEKEHIRVQPDHPLYGKVLEAMQKEKAHDERRIQKRISKEEELCTN